MITFVNDIENKKYEMIKLKDKYFVLSKEFDFDSFHPIIHIPWYTYNVFLVYL